MTHFTHSAAHASGNSTNLFFALMRLFFVVYYYFFSFLNLILFLILFIYLFLERQEGRNEERERSIDVPEKHPSVTSCMPLTGDRVHNRAMCLD